MSAEPARRLVGILLAAGRGARFGGDKLLARARSDPNTRTSESAGSEGTVAPFEAIGVLAFRKLQAVVPEVVAVVRPDAAALAASLSAAGARIVRCANADDGMGASLACGVRSTKDAAGWIVALGDMPWIEPSTIARVVAAIAEGAVVAAPFYEGRRGHPVGFGAACFEKLAALTGDDGAKSVVASSGDDLVRIDVDDAGTLRDVDRPADLR